MSQEQSITRETIATRGSQVVEQVKHLLHEGTVRRVIVRDDERVIAEFPLVVGVLGAVIAPTLAALGALAALLGDCTIEIEREDAVPVAESVGGGTEAEPPVATQVSA
jgi:hypothetical protein